MTEVPAVPEVTPIAEGEFVRVTFKEEGKRQQSFWAIKGAEISIGNMYTRIDKEGGIISTREKGADVIKKELISPSFIVKEEPAHIDRTYGEMRVRKLEPPTAEELGNPHLLPENVPEEDFTTVTDVGSIYDLFSEGKISLRELDRLKDHYYKWYYSPELRTTVLRFYRQPDGTMTIYKQVYVQTYGEIGNPGQSRLEPWQMTLEQYAVEKGARPAWVKAGYGETYRFHKRAVERALKEGKPVPPEVLADYPALRTREGNPDTGTSIIDLRGDYDEIAHVKDGILYRKGNIIQVWWDKWGKETWTGPSEEQARENFNAMKERWSSSELGNPKEPWQMTQSEYVDGHIKSPGMHRESVRLALKEGKPVPPEVLADYPDLKAPAVEVPAVPEITVPLTDEAVVQRGKDLAPLLEERNNAMRAAELVKEQLDSLEKRLGLKDVSPALANQLRDDITNLTDDFEKAVAGESAANVRYQEAVMEWNKRWQLLHKPPAVEVPAVPEVTKLSQMTEEEVSKLTNREVGEIVKGNEWQIRRDVYKKLIRSTSLGAAKRQNFVLAGQVHKLAVERAVREGKVVPVEVLVDYPNLKPPTVEVPAVPEVKPQLYLEKYRKLVEKYPDRIDKHLERAKDEAASVVLGKAFGETVNDFFEREPAVKRRYDEVMMAIREMEQLKKGDNPEDKMLLKVAIEREPLRVAKQWGYEVHQLSPKDIVDKDDYARGYRYRLSKADPTQPYPRIVMARNKGEVAAFLKKKIGGNPARVRYDRADIDSTIAAAKRLVSEKDLYIFATHLGYTIDRRPPPGMQSYVIVHPDGSTETIKPIIGGNPIPEELDLARTLAIIDSRPKGRIIESKLREEFGDAVIDALRQGSYVVSGSAGYNPPLLVSLKGRELIQGSNPTGKVITKEDAIGLLERLSMTPGEAARSLVADEAERGEIMQTVQQRVKREQNKWAPMDPREGPPLPRIFAGLRWPWKK